MTLYYTFIFLSSVIYTVTGQKEEPEKLVCGYSAKNVTYIMFPGRTAFDTYVQVTKDIGANQTGLEFCIKAHMKQLNQFRRGNYGESCPVFCPNHYRPVCGASKFRDYVYRTFTNGCYFDMLNCRGEDEYDWYTEVPLQYCQNHAMKNIFGGKVVMTNFFDYRDYS